MPRDEYYHLSRGYWHDVPPPAERMATAVVKCCDECIPACDFCIHFNPKTEQANDKDGNPVTVYTDGSGTCDRHEKEVESHHFCDDFHCRRVGEEAPTHG